MKTPLIMTSDHLLAQGCLIEQRGVKPANVFERPLRLKEFLREEKKGVNALS